jgi:hypothetical protein
MRTQVNTTQRKNKNKQSTKIRLKPYGKRHNPKKKTEKNN